MSESQQARVQAQFGSSAAAYVASAGHAAGPDLEWLVAWGRKRGAARVLDIALFQRLEVPLVLHRHTPK